MRLPSGLQYGGYLFLEPPNESLMNLSRLTASLVLLSLLTTPAWSQNLNQYKRIHQDALSLIEKGKVDEAIERLEGVAAKLPKDAETFFMLGVAYAQAGDVELSSQAMKKAIDLDLPPGRVAVGPRDLLSPLAETDFYKELIESLKHEIVHGPMVGSQTSQGASLWLRTAEAADVKVTVGTADVKGSKPKSFTGKTTAESDYTAVISMTGLEPSSKYAYEVLINGKPASEFAYGSFKTMPAKRGSGANFKLAFGGGSGYVPQNERMWNTIHQTDPDLLVLLGDNVYIDDPTSPRMQKYCYYRRQSRPEYRELCLNTPVYTIWDDHDFGTNDCWGGPEVNEPNWKPDVWNIYRQNWVNPAYGGGEKQPGVWYAFSHNDVDFIMLDGRYYREKPKSKDPSMLGPVQMKWLKDRLLASKGTFKVICSPVPWVFEAKGDSRDTWNGYQKERNEIFDFITEHKIEGVILMSADRHRSDAWKIEREGTYPLYEFNSSRLTNQHVHPEMKAAVFSYNKKQSFGTVAFDFSVEDPTVKYDVVDIDGKTQHSLTVKLSELK